MESVIFVVPNTEGAPIHFLLAVLNSKLVNYLYATKFLNVAIKAEYLKDTPIPKAPENVQNKLSNLAKKILALKKSDSNADTSALEAEIDELVFDLYGLTEEEKAIVRASGAQKSSASAEATADKEDGEQETEVSGPKSAKKVIEPKAKRGRKPQLPPSLPGWD